MVYYSVVVRQRFASTLFVLDIANFSRWSEAIDFVSKQGPELGDKIIEIESIKSDMIAAKQAANDQEEGKRHAPVYC